MIKSDFDKDIQAAVERFLPGVDWRLVKTQLYQESGLEPQAISPAGARGIAQFMPKTWDEISKKMGLPWNATPFGAYYAIPACCFYMRELYDKWTAPRPEADRYALALASYNAGFGNLLKAQSLAGGVSDYASIINKLDRVTGFENARETRTYVDRIFNYYLQLLTSGTL